VKRDLPVDCLIYWLVFVSHHADRCGVSPLDTYESPCTSGRLADWSVSGGRTQDQGLELCVVQGAQAA